jgi:4-carboxymuconolactone decarboxylase
VTHAEPTVRRQPPASDTGFAFAREQGPRIAPLDLVERTERQRQLLDLVGGDTAANIFTTLVRNPALLDAFLPFCLHLLRCRELSKRHRELIILRTAWLCGTYYEWAHHVEFARRAGLTDAEITSLDGPISEGWAADDHALLVAVDELHANHAVTESTWLRLTMFLDAEQLITVPMLVGEYTMLAGMLNTLRVAPDVSIARDPSTDWPRR